MKIYEGRIVYNLISQGKQASLDTPQAINNYLRDAFNDYPLQEQFIAIPLNRKNQPFGRFIVSIGTAHAALVHPREVYQPAILAGASALAVSHNHPSGNPLPSQEDLRITRQLCDAGAILGIKLLDHLIIGNAEDDPGNCGYYSFSEMGLL